MQIPTPLTPATHVQRARRALVTGASSGIGEACARGLAQDGFDVVLTYRGNRSRAEEIAETIRAMGRDAWVEQLELQDVERAEAQVEAIFARGPIDAVVNNAGISPRRPILEETVEGWQRTVDVNLTGCFLVARAAAHHMVGAAIRGSIVNVTSVLATVPLQGCGAYCASKAGLELLTRVLALELAGQGIRVNAVAPGHTATPMNYGAAAAEAHKATLRAVPMGRPARAEEVAAGIRHLVSPAASYVTGASLLVDGGLLLNSGSTALEEELSGHPVPTVLANLPPTSLQKPT